MNLNHIVECRSGCGKRIFCPFKNRSHLVTDVSFVESAGMMREKNIIACYYTGRTSFIRQGHIPLQVLGFMYNEKEGKWDDQPGKDTASELSLENAIDYALRFARVKMCPQEKEGPTGAFLSGNP